MTQIIKQNEDTIQQGIDGLRVVRTVGKHKKWGVEVLEVFLDDPDIGSVGPYFVLPEWVEERVDPAARRPFCGVDLGTPKGDRGALITGYFENGVMIFTKRHLLVHSTQTCPKHNFAATDGHLDYCIHCGETRPHSGEEHVQR